jgi:glucose-6-phosphate 1-dehydrogenase
MYRQKNMPERFAIVACGRSIMNDQEFSQRLYSWYQTMKMELTEWEDFARHIFYRPITYDEKSFSALREELALLDQSEQTQGNRIYDLAVPPHLYPTIATLLGKSRLADQHQNNLGWARIIIEKPFGHDLASARQLNQTLHEYFSEEQIFRIDHYLAKETIQNVLVFRFANTIFEPIWNNHYIDSVGIVAAEELGVGGRAGYYDEAGVLRDMFQNHLMQLLVLTAMEPPYRLSAEAVQDEKAKVISSLTPFDAKDATTGSKLCLGQYTAGTINGEKVVAYRDEEGVAPGSLTPTFAHMEAYIDNWRWQGVPFHIFSGKRLPKKKTRIVIQFKKVPHRLFGDTPGDIINANRLIIETYPQEAIRLSFQAKNPGTEVCLRNMTMDFTYLDKFRKTGLDAYGRVLLDGMRGDHMLFWRQDGIELSWSFLTPVLEQCEQCDDRVRRLHFYPAGSWGSKPTRHILSQFIS